MDVSRLILALAVRELSELNAPAGRPHRLVSRVLSDRRILVTHANWVRHQVSDDVPVIDVSPGNDWTRARVWWPPTNQMGVTEYATFGFIQANSPFEHDQISAKTRQLGEVPISE